MFESSVPSSIDQVQANERAPIRVRFVPIGDRIRIVIDPMDSEEVKYTMLHEYGEHFIRLEGRCSIEVCETDPDRADSAA